MARTLVSGGTDALVTIWDLSGGTPPRVLHGHTWVVSGGGMESRWEVAGQLWVGRGHAPVGSRPRDLVSRTFGSLQP